MQIKNKRNTKSYRPKKKLNAIQQMTEEDTRLAPKHENRRFGTDNNYHNYCIMIIAHTCQHMIDVVCQLFGNVSYSPDKYFCVSFLFVVVVCLHVGPMFFSLPKR